MRFKKARFEKWHKNGGKLFLVALFSLAVKSEMNDS